MCDRLGLDRRAWREQGQRLIAVEALLADPAARTRQTEAQQTALTQMGRGGPDPSEAAANVVLKLAGRAV